MRVAVIRFLGSNCDQDALHALRDDLGLSAKYVWYEETSLAAFDGVFIPGGFSYGDYLRCGAMASRTPVMEEVRRFAREGRPVLGACNGFQILCESELLPGALMLNESEKFLCQDVYLRAENRTSPFTESVDRVLRIPIAHKEGRYVCDEETLRRLMGEDQVAFTYVDELGLRVGSADLHGSVANIAGVLNSGGNVLGMMPHPERATSARLGYGDGALVLSAFQRVLV